MKHTCICMLSLELPIVDKIQSTEIKTLISEYKSLERNDKGWYIWKWSGVIGIYFPSPGCVKVNVLELLLYYTWPYLGKYWTHHCTCVCSDARSISNTTVNLSLYYAFLKIFFKIQRAGERSHLLWWPGSSPWSPNNIRWKLFELWLFLSCRAF